MVAPTFYHKAPQPTAGVAASLIALINMMYTHFVVIYGLPLD